MEVHPSDRAGKAWPVGLTETGTSPESMGNQRVGHVGKKAESACHDWGWGPNEGTAGESIRG